MFPHKKPKKPSNQAEKLPPKHPNIVKNKPSLTLQLDGVGIVKGSERWKSIYSKNRSSVERCMKRILIDYKLERARVYSRKQWVWRIALICINIHPDAWRDYVRPNIVGRLTSWAEEAD